MIEIDMTAIGPFGQKFAGPPAGWQRDNRRERHRHSADRAGMKAVAANKSPATLQVRVRSMRWEAPGVLSLDLTAPDRSPLPGFEPGAHIDLHLPNGVMRAILARRRSQTTRRAIALPSGRSAAGCRRNSFIASCVPVELLAVGAPRNNFELADAENSSFHCRRHRHHTTASDDAQGGRGAETMDPVVLQPQRG